MKPRPSRFGILYSLFKVHKQLVGNCSPFRPIMSAVETLTYNLAGFLVLLLEPTTTNMYTVRKSYEFAKAIADQDPGLSMASLDVGCRVLLYQCTIRGDLSICVVILCLAMMQKLTTLTELILKNF